jgi:hypothetical protein
VKGLRRQVGDLKEVVAELMLENRLLKQSMTGSRRDAKYGGFPGSTRTDEGHLLTSVNMQ